VYALYQTRNRNAWDPTRGVRIRLPDGDAPDPFTRDEIDAILRQPTRMTQELNLIQFMIWAGPRVSEAIALAWEDVDLEAGVLRFRRARVRSEWKVTKTKRSTRVVELLSPALAALKAQEAITKDLNPIAVEVTERDNRTKRIERIRPVFLKTNTGKPHPTDFGLRARFFNTHLDRAGVRQRGPGQCRHTFVSQCLTAGVDIKWLCDQVGHTTPAMIYKTYGKWLRQDAKDTVARVERLLGLR
jgi:integrase